MAKKNNNITLRINGRQLATILAGLRFHQAENLQAGRGIPDQAIEQIATDGGLLKPLDFKEVGRLCERLNTDRTQPVARGLVIAPPHKAGGQELLFRVVYFIDVWAANPLDAARKTHRLMIDPESLLPVLEVMDHRGKTVSIDLSQEAPA